MNGKNSKRRVLPLKMPDFLKWNKIFALVCVVAVSLDPLFIYVPTINQDHSCLTMDKTLATTAVVFRFFADLIYIGDIIYNVVKSSLELKRYGTWKTNKFFNNALAIWKLSWLHILVDSLAILPIPQIIMLNSFKKVRGSGYLNKRKLLNVILISQYVPRVFRIYISSKEATRVRDVLTDTVWIRGAFNFFLYILASHVFGAFWYFFSVQRETACWFQACKRSGIANCGLNTFCDDENAPTNYIQLVHSKCPINVDPDDTIEEPFDFGIFLDAVKSGLLGSYDFPRKLVYCFWWGLRNLSSLGSNLKTSTSIWETYFAISVSIVGLQLFLLLIGNLQTYLQLATTRSEERRLKMKQKAPQIDECISRNGLTKEKIMTIMEKVQHSLEVDKDINVETLVHALRHEYRRYITRELCRDTLKKYIILHKNNVNENEEAREKLVEVICEHMKPVAYKQNSCIIREGDPCQMVLIAQGSVLVITGSSRSNSGTSTSTSTKELNKGDIYGGELVNNLLLTPTHDSPSGVPISNEYVISATDVEGFAVNAKDLINASADNHRWP